MALQPDGDTRPAARVRQAGFPAELLGCCIGKPAEDEAAVPWVRAAPSTLVRAPDRSGADHNRMGVQLIAGNTFMPGDAITWLDGRIVDAQQARDWAAAGGPHAATVFKVIGTGDEAFGIDCLRAVHGVDAGPELSDWPCLTAESVSMPRVQPGGGPQNIVPLRQYKWGGASLARYNPNPREEANATFDFEAVAAEQGGRMTRLRERRMLNDAFPGLVLYATMTIFVDDEIFIARPEGVEGDRLYPGLAAAGATTSGGPSSGTRVDPRAASPPPEGVAIVREVLPETDLHCVDRQAPRYLVLWQGENAEVSWVREGNLSAPARAGPFIRNLLESHLADKATMEAADRHCTDVTSQLEALKEFRRRLYSEAHSNRPLPEDMFPRQETLILPNLVRAGRYGNIQAARLATIHHRKELVDAQVQELMAKVSEATMQILENAGKIDELTETCDLLREKLQLWRLAVIRDMYLLAMMGAAEAEYLLIRRAAARRADAPSDVAQNASLMRFGLLAPQQWVSQAAVPDRLVTFDQVRAYLRRRVQLRWEAGYSEYARGGSLAALERAFPALDARWRQAVEAAASVSGEAIDSHDWMESPWYDTAAVGV